ncbi:hypothetical protein AB2B38_004830 [Balneola sp. MJW-20]|uniref:hypothetical protein n=1 Tax=Gracilimonas aurantiaca TaxID=3234185 RepID=UPI0034666700
MKRFFRWLFYTLAGAAIGYSASFLIDMNEYLLMGIGIIFGSSIGITINIQESKDESFYRAIDREYEGEEESDDAGENQVGDPNRVSS